MILQLYHDCCVRTQSNAFCDKAQQEDSLVCFPQVLGLMDYPHFRHHNDDQSAFSLLFKLPGKFGRDRQRDC